MYVVQIAAETEL